MRLIDADWLAEHRRTVGSFDMKWNLDLAPTIDAKPIVHGRWTYGEDGTMKCTRCRKRIKKESDFRYCPNCGAKMDLGG